MLLSISAPSFGQPAQPGLSRDEVGELIADRCEGCHNDYDYAGNWSLEEIHVSDIERGKNQKLWEAILKSVSMGDMPPADKKQLTIAQKAGLLQWLQTGLDDYSEQHPNPGRSTLRRLNRSEYANSVRDLLALEEDITPLLPGDVSGYGFDNNADVLGVSTTLLERYLSVAGKVSRLATGLTGESISKKTYVVPKDGSVKNSGVPSFDLRTSEQLPLDSRGGGSFDFYAPVTGVYEIAGYLNANTNNEVDRLDELRYHYQLTLSAGHHSIGMSFRKQLALSEHVPTIRKGTEHVVLPDRAAALLDLDFIVDGARVNSQQVPSYHMSSRFSQAAFLRDVLEMEVVGPFASEPGLPDTPSTQKIFICSPTNSAAASAKQNAELDCARSIIASLTTEAYRRPVTDADVSPLLNVYKAARKDLDFTSSIATTLQALLISPGFLYLQEPVPDGVSPGSVYQLSDSEFAARLALFLWSSLPDKELTDLALAGQLREPDVLSSQIKRMLKSDKARALTDNFAGQWLYLRNIPFHTPDVFEFPQFTVPLRQSIKRETELFFTRILKDDKPIFDFLNADYSYLNQQLAEHYGIEGVSGSAFREVDLTAYPQRGGLLGQASILTLTSNPNHTSPVKRGKWILDNLLAASPPPPPPDVPALVAEHDGVALTAREQLKRHRQDPVCAACHIRMDPLGLALEKYDAVGAFRTSYASQPIDVSARMPDGTQFEGLPGLQQVLWDRRERFAMAFTERLLTYALGRGLEAYDQPVIRDITRQASAHDYRIHSIIEAVVTSMPFNFKKAPEAPHEKQQFVKAH
ncbi:filamin [Alteromonas lipolytica]|nr:filamin [Alteromonas lipolytica]